MRTIIAGSRSATDYDQLCQALAAIDWTPSVVIRGTARGADRLGERWAEEHGVAIERYPADWNRFGKRAGYLRNADMAQRADALLALWDGESRGTQHIIKLARQQALHIHVWRIA